MSDINNNWKKGPTYILTFLICVSLLIVSGLFVFYIGAVSLINSSVKPNMSGIGTAVAIYMNDNKGSAPTKDKWCDLLIQHADLTPYAFNDYGCDYIQGETILAFNKVDIDADSPASLVMFFESEVNLEGKNRDYPIEQRGFMQADKEGLFSDLKGTMVYKDLWNISGGPEKLAIKSGCHYYPILYCDSHCNVVKQEELASLRWDIENTDYSEIIQTKIDNANMILESGYKKIWYIITILAGAVLLSLTKFQVARDKFKALVICSICVSLLGWFLGRISFMTHISFHDSNIGSILGLSSGLLLAIWYYAFITNIPAKFKKGPSLLLWTILPGMVCGGISSGIIHGTIVSITGESFQNGVLPGLIFGISAGAMIGVITAGFIKSEAIIESTEQIPL